MQHHEPRLENGLLFVVIVGHSTPQIPSVQGQSQYNVVFKQYLSSRQLEGSPVDANPAKLFIGYIFAILIQIAKMPVLFDFLSGNSSCEGGGSAYDDYFGGSYGGFGSFGQADRKESGMVKLETAVARGERCLKVCSISIQDCRLPEVLYCWHLLLVAGEER